MQLTTVEAALRGEDIECDGCSSDVPEGEVVVLDGMLYGAQCCAWARAAAMLDPLNVSCWTPAEIESGRRDYEDALRVMEALAARMHARLARRA